MPDIQDFDLLTLDSNNDLTRFDIKEIFPYYLQ